LIGVIETTFEEDVSKDRATFATHNYDNDGQVVDTYHFVETRLLLINLEGEVVESIVGVKRYAWSPSGDNIVYIAGLYTGEGAGFRSQGTWIHDVESGEATPIHSGGYDVRWATWDNNIYILDPALGDDSRDVSVLRFDATSQGLFPTMHKGIDFSEDGRYYFANGTEGGGFTLRIHRTATDEELDPSFRGSES
jgi:hypothetical protein